MDRHVAALMAYLYAAILVFTEVRTSATESRNVGATLIVTGDVTVTTESRV